MFASTVLETYTTTCMKENDQEDSIPFLDEGYSPNEAWDTLVWYLDVEIYDTRWFWNSDYQRPRKHGTSTDHRAAGKQPKKARLVLFHLRQVSIESL